MNVGLITRIFREYVCCSMLIPSRVKFIAVHFTVYIWSVLCLLFFVQTKSRYSILFIYSMLEILMPHRSRSRYISSLQTKMTMSSWSLVYVGVSRCWILSCLTTFLSRRCCQGIKKDLGNNPQNKIGVGGKSGGMTQQHVQSGPLMWTCIRYLIFSIVWKPDAGLSIASTVAPRHQH